MIRNILALCVATLIGGISSQALAQAYPNKPIKIIVPAGPGDSCDILTRLIAPKLTERWQSMCDVLNCQAQHMACVKTTEPRPALIWFTTNWT